MNKYRHDNFERERGGVQTKTDKNKCVLTWTDFSEEKGWHIKRGKDWKRERVRKKETRKEERDMWQRE